MKKKYFTFNVQTSFSAEKDICNFCGKICYSKREAGIIINSKKKHLFSDHLGRQKEIPKRSYYCEYCGCFHLTHIPFFRKSDVQKRIKFYYRYG